MTATRRLSLAALRGPLLLLVVGAVAGYAWLHDRAASRDGAPAAPDWRAGVVPCRAETLAHVHHPTRLVVLAPCATAGGVVQTVRYRPEDGDWEVRLRPDAESRRALPAANRGVLVARVIPTDRGRVVLPTAGRRVDVYGAWVLDRNRNRIAELHPAWAIAPAGARAPPSPAAAGAPLRLAVTAPPSRGVGDLVPLRIRATRASASGAARPEAQVHVFVEMTDAAGRGVDWRAVTTNTLGAATINMLALHVPGRFAVDVYADKRGREAHERLGLVIRRRAPGNRGAGATASAPAEAVRDG